MRTIQTETRVPDPEHEGKFLDKPRKMEEVFQDIRAALEEADLVPDENFNLPFDCRYGSHANADFPEISDLLCTVAWGGSEGIYLDVTIKAYQEGKYAFVPFITGKSLGETEEAFDRMQYISGYIYRLLMGDGTVHPRYILVRTAESEKNQAFLMERLNREMTALMKRKLYGGLHEPVEYAEELALKSMLVKVLSQCSLPEEKISELLALENILDSLFGLCQKIMPASEYEIEDILASCPSFSPEEVVKG